MPPLVSVLKPLFVAVLSIGSLHSIVRQNRDNIDRFVMSIVRDLGRYKARKRRFGNAGGLIEFMKADPMQDVLVEEEDESNLQSFTEAELLEFGDGLDGRPILLSVFGRVYDVSAGAKFYGPGQTYGCFAGHDVTFALSTGCRTQECIETGPEALSESELKEGQRWLSFFHLHDKYKLVGKLEADHLEEFLKRTDLDEIKQEDGEKVKAPIF